MIFAVSLLISLPVSSRILFFKEANILWVGRLAHSKRNVEWFSAEDWVGKLCFGAVGVSHRWNTRSNIDV